MDEIEKAREWAQDHFGDENAKVWSMEIKAAESGYIAGYAEAVKGSEAREMRVAEKVRDACSKQCLEALRDPGCDGDGFCHRVDSDSINSLYLAAIIKEVHNEKLP